MGRFEVGLVGVMAFLILGILALIITSQDDFQTENANSISDVQTLLKDVKSSPLASPPISSSVPASGFEDVPEMIVREEPESKSKSAPEILVEPTMVSIPPGSSTPGCEEDNSCYVPFIVTINVGDTVVWSNDDSAAHTVTSGSPSNGPDGLFDSSIFMSATTFEHTFTESGTFDYFCMVHPWMSGQIQVN